MQALPSEPGFSDVIGHVATGRAAALLDGVVDACRSYDMPVTDARPARVEVETGMGRIQLAAGAADMAIRISASSAANAFMLREAVVARIEEVDATLLPGLRWSGALETDGLPPNFRAGRVRSVEAAGPLFWRLVIEAADLVPFARDGLHMRLALPRRGREPVWPRVDAAGRTRWPEAPDDLHVAVYTIRGVEPASGTLTVDAFRHGRGPTCAWLGEASAGDPVGILGPGGGWLPDARHLTLAGDETAFPAIARILGEADPATTGTVLLEAAHGLDCPPVKAPPGVVVRVLCRASGERLERELERVDLGPAASRHVWFAAEKRRATAMRRVLRDHRGVTRDESYVAAYWVDQ